MGGAGPFVRELRGRLGVSMRELARRLGWEAGHLSRCESGKLKLSLDALDRIAVALGLEPAAVAVEAYASIRPRTREGRAGEILAELLLELRKASG